MSERRKVSIPAGDGYRLAADLFFPVAPSGSAVVINGAMGVARRFYQEFAAHLAAQGFHVVCYDYRGIGESAPARLRGFNASIEDWGRKDFAGVLDWVERELHPARLLVVGHSVGGQIVGLAPEAARVDRLLLVAAQSGYWKHWPGLKRPLMWMLWHAWIPGVVSLAGKLPMKAFGQGEDLPPGVARQWARWGRLPGYLFDPRSGVDLSLFRSLRMPLCAYSFDDDAYAPRPAVQALLAQYRDARIEQRHLDANMRAGRRVGHFGFFKRANADLWEDAAHWLQGEQRSQRERGLNQPAQEEHITS